jgi:adenine-specific DNA-methyltransferase
LAFDYSHSGKKVSILEPLVGKSGFMRVICDTVMALETEDFVLLSGICDDGTNVDAEQCRRFFSLGASDKPPDAPSLPEQLEARLNDSLQRQQNEVRARLTERNAGFFESELDKLDRWSDDLKVGLEQELKEFDRQIRESRRSAQIAAALAEKLSIQKQVKELEASRNRKRRELFDAQDRVDKQRQDLIETIEKKLQQDCKVTTVFTVRWSLI